MSPTTGISHNTFTGGMNQDTAAGKMKSDQYWIASNMRLSNKDYMSIGNIENEKGNELSFTFPDSEDQIYVFDIVTDGTWIATFGFNGITTSVTTASDNVSDHLFDFIEASATSSSPGALLYSSDVKGYEYSIYENLRIMRKGNRFVVFGKNLFSLTMTKTGGTAEVVQNGQTLTDNTIIGYTNLRDKLILFSTNKANVAEEPTTTNGAIWMVEYNDNDAIIDLDTTSLDVSKHLIYAGDLNFSLNNEVKAVAFRVNDDTGKVYWTDNYNNLRHINVYDYNSSAVLEENLNLVPKISSSKPQITDLVDGGSYKSGRVYYSYQLYNKYGAESTMSPISNGVNLAEIPATLSDTSKFTGSAVDVNTGKAVSVSISDIDSNFDRIRLFSIFYERADSTPVINMVFDKRIRQMTEIDAIDDGYSFVGTLTLQELRDYEKLLFSCKDLTMKDNRIICGNILEDSFDVTYDARAYRHATGSTTFKIDNSTETVFANVDTYADCAFDIATDYPTYKFQQSSTLIGGTGTNISYAFSTVELPLDKNSNSGYHYSAGREFQQWSSLDSNLLDNDSYSNYASPINSSQMVGYKRGEIYRFGIIFRDSRGRISPAKWIADIKFPEMDDSVFSTSETTGKARQYLDFAVSSIAVTKVPDWSAGYDYPDYDYTVSDTDTNTHTFTLTINGVTAEVVVGGQGDGDVSADGYIGAIQDILDTTFNGLITAAMGIDTGANVIYIRLRLNTITAITITTAQIVNSNGPATYTFTNTPPTAGAVATLNANVPVMNIADVATAKVLYPVFNIDNVPLDDDGNRCSYQIVRVPRTEKDMTRLTQGLLLPTINTSAGVTNESYPIADIEVQDKGAEKEINGATNDGTGAYLVNNYLVNLISPEINFRSYDIKTGDVIRITATVDPDRRSYEIHKETAVLKIDSMVARDSVSTWDGTISYSGIVKADNIISSDPTTHTIKDYTIRNVIKDNKKVAALAGTSLFATVGSKFSSVVADDLHIAEIVRTLSKQYGGNAYYNRQNSEYTGCGHFKEGHSGDLDNHVFGGDTYIAYFDYLRAMWSDKKVAKANDAAGQYQQVLFIPVETVINLDYRYDKSFSKISNTLYSKAKYLQENAGDYSAVVSDNEDANYLQDYDLYLENRVYSGVNDVLIYLPKLEEETLSYRKDSQMIISQEFNYDLLTDNFIKFLPDNTKIINSQHGPINGVVNYNDNLIIFQDKAIGVQQVNERSITQDQTGASIVLGTGDILGQFSYLTISSGCMHRSSIVTADSGLYYFDAITRTFNTIGGNKEVEVSTMKGMSSYFNNIIHTDIIDSDNPLLNKGVSAVYDENNKRILMTYKDGSHGFTVSYNELFNVFESLYSFQPSIYVKTFENRILSIDSTVGGNKEDIYLHDIGDYGDYYGVKETSYVTFIANDKPLVNKIWSNVEWNSRVSLTTPYSPTDTYYDETINFVDIYNDYQTSGTLTTVQNDTGEVIPSSPLEIKRRNRKWRFAVPRYDDPSSTRNARFSSTYLFMKFKYTNNTDKRFILDDVLTYYYPALY